MGFEQYKYYLSSLSRAEREQIDADARAADARFKAQCAAYSAQEKAQKAPNTPEMAVLNRYSRGLYSAQEQAAAATPSPIADQRPFRVVKESLVDHPVTLHDGTQPPWYKR